MVQSRCKLTLKGAVLVSSVRTCILSASLVAFTHLCFAHKDYFVQVLIACDRTTAYSNLLVKGFSLSLAHYIACLYFIV